VISGEDLPSLYPDALSGMFKHGTGDQKPHGSWANGGEGDVAPYELSSYHRANFNETYDYDEMVKVYTERYGQDSTRGVEESELRALNDYANHGYLDTNAYLRGALEDRVALTPNESEAFASRNSAMRDIAFRDNPVVGESIESQNASHDRSIRIYAEKNRDAILTAFNAEKKDSLQKTVNRLDEIIDDSPLHFRDTTLYRSMSSRGLSTLKVGDVVTDKGFMSTTRVDITDPKNIDVLGSLSGLGSGAKRQVAVIYPDSSRSMGRGIAVDAIKLVSGDSTDVSTREKEVLLPRNTKLKFLGYGIPKMGDRTMETNGQVAVFKRLN
jgi:dsDNA-binding SOS-regulon protein